MSGGISIVGEITIGIAAAALGLLPLFADEFAPKSNDATIARVVIGATTGDLAASLSGNTPGIALWDERGSVIGTTPGTSKTLPQGNFVDISITANPDVGNVPAAYVGVSNGGDDAICITGITLTHPDGSKAGFSGSVGALCGAPSFLSSRTFGDSSNAPPCIWIDRDNSLGLKFQGFGFHVRDFSDNTAMPEAYKGNQDLMCKSGPRFRMYEKLRAEDPILTFQPALEYNDDGTDADISKVIENPGVFAQQDESALRKVCEDQTTCKDVSAERCGPFRPPGFRGAPGVCLGRKLEKNRRELVETSSLGFNTTRTVSKPGGIRPRPFDGSIIVSSQPGHSARWLCNTETTWGPSFVSLSENVFCDMEDKHLYDVCSNESATCCFDLNEKKLRQCTIERDRKGRIVRRSVDDTRVYGKVQNWS